MDNTFQLATFEEAAQSHSLAKRQQIFDQYLNCNGENRRLATLTLLMSPYQDLFEAMLDYCDQTWVQSQDGISTIELALSYEKYRNNDRICQAILILMQRMDSLPPPFVEFYHQCLDSSDDNVRYQAFCLAELSEESGDDYLDRLKTWLCDSDEDFRIVAIQALSRLNPDWAQSVLESRLNQAIGVEAFHILLALIHHCQDKDREKWTKKLMACANDDRFSFAAIQSLGNCGTYTAIPVLLEIARSFLGEPTVRVAAAAAAAKLGSDEGMKLLLKFSQSRHGNPKYATELLNEIEQTKICDKT